MEVGERGSCTTLHSGVGLWSGLRVLEICRVGVVFLGFVGMGLLGRLWMLSSTCGCVLVSFVFYFMTSDMCKSRFKICVLVFGWENLCKCHSP
jgi:hypothetical protein